MIGYVYVIRSHQTDDIYFGSTTQMLCKRMAKHRESYRYWLDDKYHYVSSFEILKHEDAYIELVETVNFENKKELHAREGHHIRENNCVNKNIMGRTEAEWREANKEIIAEKSKIWRDNNKPAILEKKRLYYEANKEMVLESQKQYNEANKAAIAEKKRLYREANKAALSEKKRLYREANREAILEKKRLHWEANKEAINERRREARLKKAGS